MIYVDSAVLIKEAAETIASNEWVSLDTEADSLHHFVEKLCLLQLSVPGHDFILDPLCGVDLSEFLRFLQSRSVIIHGADFDLKILNKYAPFAPKSIFDTLIAAHLLGYPKQGLADLALKHCGVSLCKKSQKADWSERPLGESLLEYAANDTRYLIKIKEAMERELEQKQRLSWHREICQRLLENAGRPKGEDLPGAKEQTRPWQIQGAKKLSPRGLTYLRQLWLWRMEQAQTRDKPFFKILSSDYLIRLSEWAEKHPGEDVAGWPSAPRHLKGVYREAINHFLKEAGQMPPTTYLHKKPKHQRKKWHAAEHNRYEALKQARRKLADEFGIAPYMIATNLTLEKITTEAPKDMAALRSLNCLMRWQADVAGERFLSAI